jgi:LacI family transcriptional regulator, gluconate utilization system Gnt-I transcriptional repressor
MADAPAPTRTRRPRKRAGGLTLADVARVAGVSPITVSRALNTPGQLNAATLERVREAVSRTGYVPNRVAGGLASNRTGLVAALVPTVATPVFLETVQALTRELEHAGYQVMLGQSGYGTEGEEALLDAIIGRRPDGIVVTGIMHSPVARRRLAAAGIPIVETWDLTPTPIDMVVGFSHEKAGLAVGEYLLSRGSRKPAVLSADDPRAGLRREGFAHAVAKAGVHDVPIELVPTPTTLGAGRRALAALIDREPGIDAVFCSSDILALGALIEARVRGIDVPSRLRVMGFGDNNFAADTDPALSTVRIDGTAIGRQAARFVIDRAMGRAVDRRVVDVGFELVPRGST